MREREARPVQPLLRVALLPLPNFTLLPFAGFIDALRLAADEGDLSRPRACRWTIMAPDRSPVRASCGAEVLPWEGLSGPERFDWIVVCGGLLHADAWQALDPRVRSFLRDAHAKRVGLIGICTGSFALAEAGLLAGRRACVSWYHYNDLIERHPDVRPVADRLWIADGRLLTCAGGTAAVDLAVYLIRGRLGEAAAQKTQRILVAEAPRPAGAAQPQPPNTVPVRDARVRRAMLLMEQSLSQPPRVAALAEQAAVSKRQLERLFREELGTGVQAFGRDLRLYHAVWAMAHGDATLAEIAAACGFADPAHMTRTFRAAFGQVPSAARAAGPATLAAMLERWWPYSAAVPARPAPEEERPILQA